MAITLIKGPPKSGKSRLANALRNGQITLKQGALLVDEQQTGGAKELIEKLLDGAPLPTDPKADMSKLPWKPNGLVILVGAKESMLAEFEKLVPGFAKLMGPIETLTTGKASSFGQ